ncbi:hypothetical protein EJV47_00840 [Hymenobacter gummosus]|uniref:Putative beta-lactamase-inhibitor-like PepSY-like domain-containing protein n=1 Tax=Hymenobacter gummosus TaxID=1776032 RepID=A0A431U8F9_9BACT|nr:PepSY-like domain-containing protein [Hymenobacter gummosus]RTQ53317.1 hypothetical protein EJV47_00840 [Hymenobacter gummosus]
MNSPKYLLLLPAALLLACNKDNDVKPNQVPEAVRSSLAARFPSTTDLEWKKVGSDYEADFEVNTVDHDALFTAAGELVKYKLDIPTTELPEAVRTAISQQYSGLTIDDAERLHISGSEAVLYQVELDRPGNDPDHHLVFAADGQQPAQPAYWD